MAYLLVDCHGGTYKLTNLTKDEVVERLQALRVNFDFVFDKGLPDGTAEISITKAFVKFPFMEDYEVMRYTLDNYKTYAKLEPKVFEKYVEFSNSK